MTKLEREAEVEMKRRGMVMYKEHKKAARWEAIKDGLGVAGMFIFLYAILNLALYIS